MPTMTTPRTVRLDTYVKHLIEVVENAEKLLKCLEILDKETYNRILADGVCYFNGVVMKVRPDGRIIN